MFFYHLGNENCDTSQTLKLKNKNILKPIQYARFWAQVKNAAIGILFKKIHHISSLDGRKGLCSGNKIESTNGYNRIIDK